MNIKAYSALISSLFLCATSYSKDSPFEDPPVLKASEILLAKLLKSPFHEIDESVSINNYGYHFRIKTDAGVDDVRSEDLLLERIREAEAIAELSKITQTQAFITSFAQAAKNPLTKAWTVASKPVSTIRGLPGGASRYLQGKFYQAKKLSKEASMKAAEIASTKAADINAESAENLSQQAAQYTSEASKEHLGFNKAKRAWAKRLKVDPYSNNETLQHALERIAWATSIASFAAEIATPTYAPLDYALEAQDLVWETPPIELECLNDIRLKTAGIDAETLYDFHEHPHYTLTAKTNLSLSVAAFKDVKGLQSLAEIVLAAESANEATMITKLISVFRSYHQKAIPLAEFEIRKGMLTAINSDGILVFPVAIDYLHWTKTAEEVARHKDFDHENRQIWLTGKASSLS